MDIRGFFSRPPPKAGAAAAALPPNKSPAPEAKNLARKRAPEEDVVDLTGEEEVPEKKPRTVSGEFLPSLSSPSSTHTRASQRPPPPWQKNARQRWRLGQAPRRRHPPKKPLASSTPAPRAPSSARLLALSASHAPRQAAPRVRTGLLGAWHVPASLSPPLTAPTARSRRRGLGADRPPGSGGASRPGRAPAGSGRLPRGRDVRADGNAAAPLSASCRPRSHRLVSPNGRAVTPWRIWSSATAGA